MSAELLNALDQLEKEKGISKESIICAIEEALNVSYGKNLETPADTRVEYNRENGQIKLYARKTVVEEVTDENCQLSWQKQEALILSLNWMMLPNLRLHHRISEGLPPKRRSRSSYKKSAKKREI